MGIYFRPEFGVLIGSNGKRLNSDAVLLLSQAVYWTRQAEGQFTPKTAIQVEAETLLTRKQQDAARKALSGFSFWQEQGGKSVGMSYRVDLEALCEAIQCADKTFSIVQNAQSNAPNGQKQLSKTRKAMRQIDNSIVQNAHSIVQNAHSNPISLPIIINTENLNIDIEREGEYERESMHAVQTPPSEEIPVSVSPAQTTPAPEPTQTPIVPDMELFFSDPAPAETIPKRYRNDTKTIPTEKRPAQTRFVVPELGDIVAYMCANGGSIAQAERFQSYYDSNGWRVGRNKMVNWKAAASGWIRRDAEEEERRAASRAQAGARASPRRNEERTIDDMRRENARILGFSIP
jgi:hypothetical protein